jgi:hypothetical protein
MRNRRTESDLDPDSSHLGGKNGRHLLASRADNKDTLMVLPQNSLTLEQSLLQKENNVMNISMMSSEILFPGHHKLNYITSSNVDHEDTEGAQLSGEIEQRQSVSCLAGIALETDMVCSKQTKGATTIRRPTGDIGIRDGPMRCCNDKCPSTVDTERGFTMISSTCKAGGQDWSAYFGKVLCRPCYNAYFKKGRLERVPLQTRVPDDERRCCCDGCLSPTENAKGYVKITRKFRAGGQDRWSPYIGKVLCRPCYNAYSKEGGQKRLRVQSPIPDEEKRCCCDKCPNPTENKGGFVRVTSAYLAGGQDPAIGFADGKVMCMTCFRLQSRKRKQETEGSPSSVRNVSKSGDKISTCDTNTTCGQEPAEKRCCYEKCQKQPESRRGIVKIPSSCKAGGKDWSAYVGQYMCKTCYWRYRNKGSLEPGRVSSWIARDETVQRCHDHHPDPAQKGSCTEIETASEESGRTSIRPVGQALCYGILDRYCRNEKQNSMYASLEPEKEAVGASVFEQTAKVRDPSLNELVLEAADSNSTQGIEDADSEAVAETTDEGPSRHIEAHKQVPPKHAPRQNSLQDASNSASVFPEITSACVPVVIDPIVPVDSLTGRHPWEATCTTEQANFDHSGEGRVQDGADRELMETKA